MWCEGSQSVQCKTESNKTTKDCSEKAYCKNNAYHYAMSNSYVTIPMHNE